MTEADRETDVNTDSGVDAGAADAGKQADAGQQQTEAGKAGEQRQPATIVGGAQDKRETAVETATKADWRDRIAGGDAAFRKQLDRYTDEAAFGKAHREATNRLRNSSTIAKPGENATEEELAAYRKANGVPEKADDYLTNLTFTDGRVLGDADKPAFNEFARAMHAINAPQEFVNRAVQWELDRQEQLAAQTAEQDRKYREEQQDYLAEKWGADKRGNINIIAPLLEQAGAGSVNEEGSLASLLLAGRLADGRQIGDDGRVIEFLSGLARRFNDIETLTEGSEPARAGESRLAELANLREKDPDKYWSKEIQDEELRLIDQQNRRRTRGA
jgi:hypothetical protein